MKHLVQENKNKIDKNPNEIRQWVSEVVDFSSEYDDVIITIYSSYFNLSAFCKFDYRCVGNTNSVRQIRKKLKD
jgi:hypothetical protein